MQIKIKKARSSQVRYTQEGKLMYWFYTTWMIIVNGHRIDSFQQYKNAVKKMKVIKAGATVTEPTLNS